jgi:hypothetical protein
MVRLFKSIIVIVLFYSCSKYNYDKCFKYKSILSINNTKIDTNFFFQLDSIYNNDKFDNNFINNENKLIKKINHSLKFSNNGTFKIFNSNDRINPNKYYTIGYFNIIDNNNIELCKNSYSVQGGWYISKSKINIINDTIIIEESISKNSITHKVYKKKN